MAETLVPFTGIDVTSYWVEQSVQNEIHRGEKLRQQKLQRTREGDAARFSKKPSLARDEYPRRSRKNYQSRKTSPSPRRRNGADEKRKRAVSNSPQSGSRSRSKSRSRRGRRVCSMRISQLAVPSKRQCIETWRSKADVLPGFMVHRLRQQIMDQTPIVQISDALTCFKYERTETTTSQKRPQRKINKEAMRQREFEENQNLSVLFGNKLLQKLMKPEIITLIPRLKNMSSVVTEEIFYVMRERRLRPKVTHAIHEQMVREISDKVTIWIAEILEDTKQKLLEEDLRVKKMTERIPTTVNGEVITLLDATVAKETELEEEEGPALDALDDVVENVLNICIPADKVEEFDDGGDISPDYLSVASENSVDTAQTAEDGDSIKEHLMNQLLDIIDTLKSDENLDLDDSVEAHPNLEEKQSEPQLMHIDNIKDENEKRSPKSDSFESITSQNLDNDTEEPLSTADEIVKPDEEKSSNVSDTLEILSEEEKNKKVKFSQADLEHLKVNSHHSKISNTESYYHNNKGTGKVASESSLSTLRNVYDSWPSDLSTNVIKPSASAIMSITSLGRILESEEKNLLSLEMEVSSEQLTTQTAENINPPDISNILDGKDETGKQQTTDVSDETKSYSNEPVEEPGSKQDSSDDNISNKYKEERDLKDGILDDGTNGDDSKLVEFINQGEDRFDDTYKALDEIATNLKNTALEAVIDETFNWEITKKENIILEDTVMNKACTCFTHDDFSEHSLVSVMLFEMQKYGEKMKDVTAFREYISNFRCACAESDHVSPQSEKPSSHSCQQHSTATDAAAATPNKFDYRVHPESAPVWLTCGQGEPGGGDKGFPYSGKKPIEEREREILKWCNDLDNILINLSKWRTWLDYITKYITTMKQKAESNTLGKTVGSKIATVDQLKPPRTIDKDIVRTQVDTHEKPGLKLYRNDETIKFKILPTTTIASKQRSCICATKITKRLSMSSPTKK